MASGGQVIVTIVGNSAQLSSALNRAAGDLDGFAGKMQTMSTKLMGIGKSMTMGLTLPIVGLGVVAFNAAQDFESAFAGVAKTVDGTAKQMAGLRQGIIDMSKVLPASTTEIAAVAEAAGQLGIHTEDILSFTRVMIDLGNTTNLAAADAANALARLANITQMPQDEFDRLGSTVVELGNKMAATESEIVEMGLRIAGAGKQVGLSEAQILSWGAALSSVGIDAEMGGSAISRTFITIANAVATGGEELDAFAETAGQSADDFKAAFEQDASGATVKFIQGLSRIAAAGGNVFEVLDKLGLGEIRVRDALLRLTGSGDLLTQSLEIGNKAWAENIALTEEAAKRYETNQAKMDIIKNKLMAVAVVLGESLMPIIEKVADFIAKLGQEFQKLDPQTQKIVLVMLGLTAALGPVVLLIGLLLNPITLVVAAIFFWVAALTALWVKWDEVMRLISDHPALAAIVIILGSIVTGGLLPIILGVMWLAKNWDEAWAWIKQAASDAGTFIVAVLQPIIDFLDGIVGAARAAWRAINDLKSIATGLFGGGSLSDYLTPAQERYVEGRASGGSVGSGSWLVGEKGPEILTLGAGANGYVTPNSAMGGATYNITVNAGIGTDGAQVGQQIVSAIVDYERGSGKGWRN